MIRKTFDAVLAWAPDLSGKICEPFTEFGKEASVLVDRMTATMFGMDGQGLAAPQIGVFQKAAVIYFRRTLYPIFNPEILESSGKAVDLEGCLSLIGATRKGELITNLCRIVRPDKITVRYQDANGVEVLREIKGHEARVFQHENDHLIGKFIIDRTGPLSRRLVLDRHRKCMALGWVYGKTTR